MYLHRPPGSSVWHDAHYFKCLHRSFPAANVSRPVPGLSGACLMVSRELYEQLGGLRGIYVRGDYEDFDLCLRLAEAGRQNWYSAGGRALPPRSALIRQRGSPPREPLERVAAHAPLARAHRGSLLVRTGRPRAQRLRSPRRSASEQGL